MDDPLPDLDTLSDPDLRTLIETLELEENEVSFRRRMLQGRIDILRAERTRPAEGEGRLRRRRRKAHRHPLLAERAPNRRGRVSHVYCAECGFQNPEASNFCSRCGSTLSKSEAGEQTMTYTPDEIADDPAAASRISAARARRSSSAPAAAGRGRASSRPPSAR